MQMVIDGMDTFFNQFRSIIIVNVNTHLAYAQYMTEQSPNTINMFFIDRTKKKKCLLKEDPSVYS